MKLLNFFKNIFSKSKKYDIELLEGIDLDNIEDEGQSIQDMIRRIKRSKKELQEIGPEYETIIEYITIMQKIDNLPNAKIKVLEKLSGLYSETLIHKENYQKLVRSNDDESNYLEKYMEELPKIIANISEHEEKQRLVKQDIYYLEGEKGELLFNRERYEKTLKFIRGSLIGLVAIAAIIVFILTTMFFIYSHDIFIPSVISLVGIIFFGTWFYIFRRYLIHEHKKNGRLYKRAIELLNKTKIKYVKNQQFLDYEYQKYKVNSSEMLQLRYDNYQKQLRNKSRYKSITNNIASIVIDIEDLLRKEKILNNDYIINNIDYFVSKKARKMLKSSLEKKQKELKKSLDRHQKEIEILFKIIKGIDGDLTMDMIDQYTNIDDFGSLE